MWRQKCGNPLKQEFHVNTPHIFIGHITSTAPNELSKTTFVGQTISQLIRPHSSYLWSECLFRCGTCVQAALALSDTTHPSSGPWLRPRFCCPAASWLTMATSETLAFRHGLFISSVAFSNTRVSPIYSVCPLVRAIVLTPVVSMPSCDYSSSINAAFIYCVEIQRPLLPAIPVRLGVSRGCNVHLMLRPGTIACPAPAKAFTSELALSMSPSGSVGYIYMGNSQFP
jgi:hypothetical protein